MSHKFNPHNYLNLFPFLSIHIYSNHHVPGIKRSYTCTRQFSVISMKQWVIVHIKISADMHMDKMNCSPSHFIPYIKLFFVGHITMMEFVIIGQSVNLFMNYPKKESQTQEKCHNNLSFWIKYWNKLSKIGSEP